MIESALVAWYRLYGRPPEERPRAVAVRGLPGVALRRHVDRRSGAVLSSVAVAGARKSLLDLLGDAAGSPALLAAAGAEVGIGEEAAEAIFHVAAAFVRCFDYDDVFAPILRVYLTFLHNLNAGTLAPRDVPRRWARFIDLVLSGTDAARAAKRSTRVGYRARQPRIALRTGGGAVTDLFVALGRGPGVVSAFARQWAVSEATAAAALRAAAALVPAGERLPAGVLPDPNEVASLWRADRDQFSRRLAAALDDYLLFPSHKADALPVSARSLPIGDRALAPATRAVPAARKAAAEHFIDTAVISVFRAPSELDDLRERLGDGRGRFSKLLTIVSHHFFRDEPLLLELGRSPRLRRYPDGPWRSRVEALLTRAAKPGGARDG